MALHSKESDGIYPISMRQDWSKAAKSIYYMGIIFPKATNPSKIETRIETLGKASRQNRAHLFFISGNNVYTVLVFMSHQINWKYTVLGLIYESSNKLKIYGLWTILSVIKTQNILFELQILKAVKHTVSDLRQNSILKIPTPVV